MAGVQQGYGNAREFDSTWRMVTLISVYLLLKIFKIILCTPLHVSIYV